jgi:DNA-directed RNA polymerase specialized sigma24 family protein
VDRHGVEWPIEVVDPCAGPERQTVRQSLWAELETAIGCLHPGQRTALNLFYLDQMSIAEVAVLTGQSEAAVKMRLSRGRGALRTSLHAAGWTEDDAANLLSLFECGTQSEMVCVRSDQS